MATKEIVLCRLLRYSHKWPMVAAMVLGIGNIDNFQVFTVPVTSHWRELDEFRAPSIVDVCGGYRKGYK